jgi:hypothetical protein
MMKHYKISGFFVFILFVFASLQSCKRDEPLTDSDAHLEFSNDTILFDTVFTSVGSATKHFKIYNRNNRTLKISKIYIAGGENSFFRMNVDGIPGREFSDIYIEAGDSLYIFTEVTVDPNNQNNPLVVTDSIIFETNGNIQDVDLVAWGQDAYFHAPANGSGSSIFVLPCNEVWMNDKPHVIYGWATVDSACNLTILAGTQVHFHNNSGLLVYRDGKLNVTGSPGNRVVFQGDRLEWDYDKVPGQWQGIWLLSSGECTIDYALIKNGAFGLRCDTVGTDGLGLTMNNTIIENHTSLGIYGNSGAKINAVNCLVDNIGQYALAITVGGEYNFNHCTFGNFWLWGDRSTPVMIATNWYEYTPGNNIVRPIDLQMNNCIVYGDQDNEMTLDFLTGSTLNLLFANCTIKTDENTSGPEFSNCQINQNPLFYDTGLQDYRLGAGSPCIGVANFTGGITVDLENTARDGSPDIGCYEFQ